MVVAPVILLQNVLGGLVIPSVEDINPIIFKGLEDARVRMRSYEVGTAIHGVFHEPRHERTAIKLNVNGRFDVVFHQEIMHPVYRGYHLAFLGPLPDILYVPLQRRPARAKNNRLGIEQMALQLRQAPADVDIDVFLGLFLGEIDLACNLDRLAFLTLETDDLIREFSEQCK